MSKNKEKIKDIRAKLEDDSDPVLTDDTPGVRTICRPCCFAEIEDKVQVGCKKGMISKYREAGANVFSAYDADENEFFIIDEKICMFLRREHWFEKYKEDCEKQLKKEIFLKYHCIVFFEDDDLDGLEKTLTSLKNQQARPPRHITVVRPRNSKIRSGELAQFVQKFKLPWKLQNLIGEMERNRCIDLVLDAPLTGYEGKMIPYASIFNSGFEVPANTFQAIQDFVFKELGQFAYIEPNDSGNGEIIPKVVYNYYGGNKKNDIDEETATLLEKIRKDEECDLKIMKITEMVKSFPLS